MRQISETKKYTDLEIKKMITVLKEKTAIKDELKDIYVCYKETQDKNLFDALIEYNDRLVLYTLSKYKGYPDYDDILQEGRLFLILALQRFDPYKDIAFSTYASEYIAGGALSYLERNKNNSIYMPFYIIEKRNRYLKIKKAHPRASKKELAELMDTTVQKIIELEYLDYISHPVSLNVMVTHEDDETELENLIEGPALFPYEDIDKEELQHAVRNMVDSIKDEKRRNILKEAFGIGCKKQTYRDLAETYNISYQAIQTHIFRALSELRFASKGRKILQIPKEVRDVEVANYFFKD